MRVTYLKMRSCADPSGRNPEQGREEGIKFLKTLYRNCDDGYIEYRPIPTDSKSRTWIPMDDIDLPRPPDGKNIFFGVATRKYGGGKKEDILQIPAVWIDVDLSRTKRDDFEKLLHGFRLPPSIIVGTGNGWHLYWILERPAGKQDILRVEEMNKRLASYFGGDTAATDAARIMRLPGTWNVKYKPPRLAGVFRWRSDAEYTLDDFDAILPPLKQDIPSNQEDGRWYEELRKGVEEGRRGDAAARLVGRYLRKGLTEEEIYPVMTDWNKRNDPPMEDKRLRDTIASIARTLGRSVGPKEETRTEDIYNSISASVMGVNDFLKMEMPDQPTIMSPWLDMGTIALISAERGIGKTFFGLSIAMAVTRGLDIGNWKTITPVGVLYLDGEMPPHKLHNRLSMLKAGLATEEKEPLSICSSILMIAKGMPSPNLTSPVWRANIRQYLADHPEYKLLILDNLGSLAPGIDENTKRDWDPINQFLLELRALGISIIMVHHTGKKGNQRGTSAREDNVDVAFELKRPNNYRHQNGAYFDVIPTKTRNFYGIDAAPFSFRIVKRRTGYVWQTDKCSAGGREKFWEILSLFHEGKQPKEIATITDCSESWVSQVKKEAKQSDLLDEKNKLTDEGMERYEYFMADIKNREKE